MSNFSFSHCVFKRLVQQTHKNQGLFGKGLNVIFLWLVFEMPLSRHFNQHPGGPLRQRHYINGPIYTAITG